MRSFRAIASPLVLVPILAAACAGDDPIDPCSGDVECGVPGLHLAFTVAEIVWAQDQPIDDRVGGRLVQPGDALTFRYRLVNTGSVAVEGMTLAAGTWVQVGNLGPNPDPDHLRRIAIDRLEPGEVAAGIILVDALDGAWTSGSGIVEGSLFVEDSLGLRWLQHSIRYHLAVPILDISIDAAPASFRPQQSDSVWVTVLNRSPVAALPGNADFVIGFCAAGTFTGRSRIDCGTDAGFSFADVPAIPANGYWSGNVEVSMPADAIPLDDFAPFGLRACVMPMDPSTPAGERYLYPGVCHDEALDLRQDLDAACSPPTVALPATLATTDAGARCARPYRDFFVWAFELTAAGTHDLDMNGGTPAGARIFGPGHTAVPMSVAGEFLAPAAGRYHIIVEPTIAAPIYTLD